MENMEQTTIQPVAASTNRLAIRLANINVTVIVTAIVTSVLLTPMFQVQAAVLKGLYEAEVPVSNQGKSERSRAMSVALAEIFARVSGDARAAGIEGLKDAISKPSQYVEQFRYHKITDTRGISAPEMTEQVWFRFDEQAVNQVLRGNGLPVWGKTRPTTLAWIAVEQDGSRFILGGGDANEDLRLMLEKDARSRGLALLLPLMDLEDQQNMRFGDLWGEFQNAIKAASQRYQPDAILIGRLFLSPSDEWQARWTLIDEGRNLSWQAQYPRMKDVMTVGVAGALELLAKRYAQVFADTDPGEFLLAVDGVSTLKDFARLSEYLKSLGQVTAVLATRVRPDSASFRLDIRGNPEGLRQTIALGNMLAKAVVPSGPGMPGLPSDAGSGAGQSDLVDISVPVVAPGELLPTQPGTFQTLSSVTEYRYQLLP